MYRRLILSVALCLVYVASAGSQQIPASTPTKPAEPNAPPLVVPDSPAQATEGLHTAAPTEDWSVLAVDKSHLNLSLAAGPVVQKWDQPDYTVELIRLEWRAGDPMDLYVVRPHGAVKPPTILYLYDYTSDTQRYQDTGWCKRVTKDGFAAVGMVSAVTGHRVHLPRPMKQWFVSQLQESLAESAHDVQMTLNYLANRGDLDVSKVGMFGQDSGAAIAVLAASVDPRITVLDLFDPWGDWPLWLKESPVVPENERPDYLKPEFLAKIANLDPMTYLPQLRSRTVRIEYVADDPGTPKAAKDAMVAAAPKSADVVIYKTNKEHYDAYKINGLSGWIEAQLHKQLPPTINPATSTIVATELPHQNSK